MEPKLELTPQSVDFLNQSAKWAKFLAIVEFIMIGWMLIVSFLMIFGIINFDRFGNLENEEISFLTKAGGIAMGFFYLILGVIVFFPTYYLYNFAKKTKKAIKENNSEFLQQGFEKIKSYWKFNGIMIIIVLTIIVIFLVPLMIIGIMQGAATV